MKRIAFGIALGLGLGSNAHAAAQETHYHLVRVIPVDMDKGVDYLAFDGAARRLYVSHGTSVVVVDVGAGVVAGKIEGMQRVHGIAVTPFGHGFVTSGNNSTVREFDMKSLATIADIPAEGGPDGLVYEPTTKRVFVFDHKGGVMTVIDAQTGKVAGTAQLGGQPEFPATDGKGTVWVNQEDKSTLLRVDARTMKQTASWPDSPCEGPTGMAFDREAHKLYVGCGGNDKLAVIDPDTGAVSPNLLPIGVHTDATHLDAARGLIFVANRANVTVVRKSKGGQYSVVQNYATLGRANTLAIDEKTHHVWCAGSLAAEDMDKLPAGSHAQVGMFVVQEFAE